MPSGFFCRTGLPLLSVVTFASSSLAARLPIVPERCGDAAHGLEAHATENSRTGILPVIPEQDGGAAHATTNGLPENYVLGNQLEEFHIRHGAHLPHWTCEGGVYAVTFRLSDSLPQSVVASWKTERDNIRRNAIQQQRPLSEIEENRLRTLYSEKVESYLDAGEGNCLLHDEKVAQLMQDTLFHFDGKRYVLLAWCIMPNHVHVVLDPLAGFDLSKIIHAWKSYSATQANRLLQRKGPFWQTEYYDHLIRDEADFRHAMEYVLNNPSKAGLSDWKWVGSK
jgi:REP element-mobilizing transposase RayT